MLSKSERNPLVHKSIHMLLLIRYLDNICQSLIDEVRMVADVVIDPGVP